VVQTIQQSTAEYNITLVLPGGARTVELHEAALGQNGPLVAIIWGPNDPRQDQACALPTSPLPCVQGSRSLVRHIMHLSHVDRTNSVGESLAQDRPFATIIWGANNPRQDQAGLR
jgi:hypothetical protein